MAMHPALAQFRRPGPSAGSLSAADLAQEVQAIDASDTNSLALEMFYARRDMVSLAVIENDRPVGLINRDIFLSQMSKPFHRELYEKKSCIAFMDKEPLIVDVETNIEELAFKTVEVGEKALVDGFIVTREGRFAGVGNGLRLLSMIAEMQAEKNRQVMQSIEYASVIQHAMLRASREALSNTLHDAALVWEPRDVVGAIFIISPPFPKAGSARLPIALGMECPGHL